MLSEGSHCAHTSPDADVNAASPSSSMSAASAPSTHVESIASSSPACKLYRNLLECVFAFGSFADLCALMRVSRDWGAAVLTMAPIAGVAVIPGFYARPKRPNLLGPVCSSRLRRHVAELHYKTRAASGPRSPGSGPQCHLDLAELRQVAAMLPWMRVVHVFASVEQSRNEDKLLSLCGMLPRATALRHLTLSVAHPGSSAQVSLAYDRVIEACSRLSSLQTLDLQLSDSSTEVSFAPFAALTQLRAFRLPIYSTAVSADDFTAGLKACSEMRRLELTSVPLTSRHLETLLSSWPLLESLELRQFNRLEDLRCFTVCAPSSVLRSLILSDLPLCPPTELEHLLGLSRLCKLIVRNLQSPVSTDLQAPFARGPRFPSLLFADFYAGNGRDADEVVFVNGKSIGAAVRRG